MRRFTILSNNLIRICFNKFPNYQILILCPKCPCVLIFFCRGDIICHFLLAGHFLLLKILKGKDTCRKSPKEEERIYLWTFQCKSKISRGRVILDFSFQYFLMNSYFFKLCFCHTGLWSIIYFQSLPNIEILLAELSVWEDHHHLLQRHSPQHYPHHCHHHPHHHQPHHHRNHPHHPRSHYIWKIFFHIRGTNHPPQVDLSNRLGKSVKNSESAYFHPKN